MGKAPVAKIDPLVLEVTALGPQTKVFEGDDKHPPLWHREVFTALPFQIHPGRHVVIVYVMTRDVTATFDPMRFRLKITGAGGNRVSGYDPIEDNAVPLHVRKLDGGAVEVTLSVTAHPRLLTIE